MVTGIVVPRRNSHPPRTVEFNGLADYQAAVGGFIETVQIQDHPLVIVANEEGRVRGLPMNRRATALWWLLNPAGIGGDVLVGDVVIFGPITDGEMTDVPERLVELLLRTGAYQVQVRLSEVPETWVPIGLLVEDFFEGAARALRLVEVWDPGGCKGSCHVTRSPHLNQVRVLLRVVSKPATANIVQAV